MHSKAVTVLADSLLLHLPTQIPSLEDGNRWMSVRSHHADGHRVKEATQLSSFSGDSSWAGNFNFF